MFSQVPGMKAFPVRIRVGVERANLVQIQLP